MAVSKILIDGVGIDLTSDTVASANDIAQGKVGHLNDGSIVIGTHSGSGATEEAEEKDVNFYGLNAHRMYSYTLAEAQALTSLPPLPTEDVEGVPMTYSWVLPLSTITNLTSANCPYNVGVSAEPTDGKTHIFIELFEWGLSPHLRLCPNGTVDIDWGDGTSHDTLTGTSTSTVKSIQHIYASAGKYHIKLTMASGSFNIPSYSITKNKLTNDFGKVYFNSISCVLIGDRANFNDSAYQNCSSLKKVTIPSHITSLRYCCFNNCISLEYLTIPSSITNIASGSIQGLKTIKKIVIPGTVVSLLSPLSATSCREIRLPQGITSINAFMGCNNLVKITIPNSVTSLPSSEGLAGCSNLKEVVLSESLTEIPSGTFARSLCINSITIPQSVTSIGVQAFLNCYGLVVIKFKSTIPPTVANANAFTGLLTDCKILVPRGSLEAYTSATNYPSSATYTYEEYDP